MPLPSQAVADRSQVTMIVDDDVWKALAVIGSKLRVSRSQIVREALREFVASCEPAAPSTEAR